MSAVLESPVVATAPVNYLLHLADNAVVLGQRNAEWCGHGPIIEEDLALANMSLDLIGQARLLYSQAAKLLGDGANGGLASNYRLAAAPVTAMRSPRVAAVSSARIGSTSPSSTGPSSRPSLMRMICTPVWTG